MHLDRLPFTRIAVCGGGYTGQALARALRRLGREVVVTDDRPPEQMDAAARVFAELEVELRCGSHDQATLLGADLVVLSPGVSIKTPAVRAALAAGRPVWGEVELAARLTDARLVGITGTKGKTTTATLASLMLDAPLANAEAYTARGVPLIDLVADHPAMDLVVVEMSSYQLESAVALRPWVACWTNLAEDHTERQPRDEYIAAKARIFARQQDDDRAVYNLDDPVVAPLGASTPCRRVPFSLTRRCTGVYADDAGLHAELPDDLGGTGLLAAWSDIAPAMRVQRPSLLAAWATALAAGGELARLRSVTGEFAGLPHRMEFVREHRGRTFINDSKATNPLATENAIRQAPAPVVLIAGGLTKGIDVSVLRDAFAQLRGLVLIGQDADKLAAVARAAELETVRHADTLAAAIETALEVSHQGDWIILSPCGASFDMFRDFADRGDQFRGLVKSL